MPISAYFLIFLIFIIIFLNLWFMYFFLVWIINRNKAAPYVNSFNKEINLMKNSLSLIKGKKLVDLWCWDGKALRFFVNTFGIKWFWYDINVFAISLGKFLNLLFGFKDKIFIYKKDFMEIDLSSFDYVYVYLLPIQLASIEDWLWKSIKKDTIIISNSFQFKKNKPFDIIKGKNNKWCIFLYKK